MFRAALGIKSASPGDPLVVVNNNALTSQTIYAAGVPYRAGQVVTNLGWSIVVAASGAGPTGMFVGICNATTMLMDSANLSGSAAWTTIGLRTVALSSPFTIPSDGLYYHLILQNGAFAVTQPTFNRLGATGDPRINGAGTFLYATAGLAATALPAVSAAVTLAAAGTPLSLVTFST